MVDVQCLVEPRSLGLLPRRICRLLVFVLVQDAADLSPVVPSQDGALRPGNATRRRGGNRDAGSGRSPAGQRTCFARTAYRRSDPTPCGTALRAITPCSSGVTSSSVTNLLRYDVDAEASACSVKNTLAQPAYALSKPGARQEAMREGLTID
jgi:hypothetical protein